MKRLLLFSLLFFSTLFSEDQNSTSLPLSITENDLSGLVNDSVNIITGSFSVGYTDIIIPGPEPLTFDRFYSSNNCNYEGLLNNWYHSHRSTLYKDQDKNTNWQGKYTDFFGSSIILTCKKKSNKFQIDTKENGMGLTNTTGGVISGKTNVKNCTFEQKSLKDKFVNIITGSGENRTYRRKGPPSYPDNYNIYKRTMNDGNKILYDFKEETLDRVWAVNNAEDIKFSELKFVKNYNLVEVHTSDNRVCEYKFKAIYHEEERRKLVPILHLIEAKCPGHPTETYEYTTKRGPDYEKLTCIRKPDGRFLETEYYDLGTNHCGKTEVHVQNIQDIRYEKVMLQKAPVGTDQTPIITHRYMYNFRKRPDENKRTKYTDGYTEVYDAQNHRTTYYFNEDHRISGIEKFTGKDAYYRHSYENLIWGDEGTQDHCNLVAKILRDADDFIVCARRFVYDERGNVLEDRLYGNFTGKNSIPIKVNNKWIPVDNGCECYVKKYTYYDNRFNSLKSETEPNGRKTFYTYKSDTDLLATKIITDEKGIEIREAYDYDSNAVLVQKVVETVTEKHIFRYTPKKNTPAMGLPEIEEESYVDNSSGQEKLLRRKRNTYSSEGRLKKQDHEDANGVYCFTLYWEYDENGNLKEEINALGEKIVRKYDSNNNLIFEKGPRNDFCRVNKYDYSNRLIGTEEKVDGKVVNSTINRFDTLSRCFASVNEYGLEIVQDYDDFGRVIKKTFPASLGENGATILPATTHQYDVFDNEIETTDASGNTVRKRYTLFGKPFHISYSDGSEESIEYNIEGTPHKKIARNGSISIYSYDALSRVIKTEIYSPTMEFIYSTSSTYDSLRQISFTDAEGIVTTFKHDGAGRKIAEIKKDRLSEYQYDSLGRLCKTIGYYDQKNASVKLVEYDFLNRVIEERIEDENGVVLQKTGYHYDSMGNKDQVIQHTEKGIVRTFTEYDPWKRPTKITDGLGHITQIFYNSELRNSLGQKVLEIVAIDPLGNQSIRIHDAFERVVEVLKKNALGEILSQQKITYDVAGNKVRVEDIAKNRNPEEVMLTCWTYNIMNQCESQVEAFGTPLQKETQWKYNAFGQKYQIIKPDGIVIDFTYDDLGRIDTQTSSDGSISYQFKYDLNNSLLEINDLKNGWNITRAYNEHRLPKTEKMSNGVEIKYDYDRLGRPVKLTLADGSAFEYVYDAAYLREVRRIVNEKVVYSHLYKTYELTGKPLLSSLPNGLGDHKIDYNLVGDVEKISSPFWSQGMTYDAVGNLRKYTIDDKDEPYEASFNYNDLYQITSEKGVEDHEYEMDSLFNRTKKDGKIYKVNQLNQLSDDGQSLYKYDLNGNLIEKKSGNETTVYGYDALDRLVSVTKRQSKVKYSYDGLNRRISKEIADGNSSSRQFYLYDGLNEIGSANEKHKIVELRMLGIGKGAEIGAAIAVELNGNAYVPTHDQVGNVMSLVDMGTKEVVEKYRYSAFGEVEDKENVKMCPWRFSSKRSDPETGLIYFGRRYYDPDTGRWITPDPIGFEGGPNLYAYVSNNPLTHVDLYGLDWMRVGDNWISENSYEGKRYKERFNSNKDSPGIGHYPGKVVKFLGDHVVSIPYVRDVFSSLGRGMMGMGWNWRPVYKDNRSHSISTPGTSFPSKVAVVVVNGICTTENDVEACAAKISNAWGHVPVDVSYNGTAGLTCDVGETVLQKAEIETRAVNETFDDLRRKIKLVGDDGWVYVLPHSQGGEIAYQAISKLNPEERARLQIFTFGSARMMPKEYGARVINYVSLGDPVPFIADPIGCLKGMFSSDSNVIFLPCKGYFGIDHALWGKTYGPELKDLGFKFKSAYGL